jgi:hypothetical protein
MFSSEDFEPSTLAFFPQRERFLYHVFLVVQPPRCNRFADKCFLFVCEVHIQVALDFPRPLSNKWQTSLATLYVE